MAGNETVFCCLYVGVMRGLYEQGEFQELEQLIENWRFPEQLHSFHYPKYLYYSFRLKSLKGEFGFALRLASESQRKTHHENDSQKGIQNFDLILKKNIILLELLNDQIPNARVFSGNQQLCLYQKLTKMVVGGLRS